MACHCVRQGRLAEDPSHMIRPGGTALFFSWFEQYASFATMPIIISCTYAQPVEEDSSVKADCFLAHASIDFEAFQFDSCLSVHCVFPAF